MRVAIIPARGGSKRIPRKNVRDFCGKPMIAWSIEAAIDSGCFDRIIVSTDDSEIASVASTLGAEVPFMRPSHLADDHAGTTAVVQHAAQWLLDHGCQLQQACCLYATAPFVTGVDLKDGLDRLTPGIDFAFSATSFEFPIQRAFRIDGDGHLAMFQPEHAGTRSQDLEHAYHDAGQFYWGTRDAWLQAREIFGKHSIPIVMPRHRVQDIDTQEDWERARWMFLAMRGASHRN